jgi:predicted P-loop ATPase
VQASPLQCTVDLEGLRRDRDQIWAEAVVRYKNGARHFLESSELIALQNAEAMSRYLSDPWQPIISQTLAGLDFVSTPELLEAVGKSISDRTIADSRRIGRIVLSSGGWVSARARKNETHDPARPWGFRRKSAA